MTGKRDQGTRRPELGREAGKSRIRAGNKEARKQGRAALMLEIRKKGRQDKEQNRCISSWFLFFLYSCSDAHSWTDT
jgi:hypothetical protein